jgi:hypothetical protein
VTGHVQIAARVAVAAAGAIESVYRPAPSTIVFEVPLAVPQSVLIPGESTVAMASRSEHVPSLGPSSSWWC